MREKLSPRRLALTERLTFRSGLPGEVKFDVTFGYEPGGPVKECFCLAFKIGADRQDEMHQACIAISVALQSGQSMSDLARIMGEDDPALPPHSMIGLIVRAGVMLDDWLTAQYAISSSSNFNRSTGAACADTGDSAEGITGRRSCKRRPIDPTSEKVEAGEKDCDVPVLAVSVVQYLAGQGGSHPAPSFRCGDSALEQEGLEDWPTQMTRLAAEEVVKPSPPPPPPDDDVERGGMVLEIPAFLRRFRPGADA
jgi:hypothetical protein